MKKSDQRLEDLFNVPPKLPTPGQLDYGELAVNYRKGRETISFKNSANEIVAFTQEVLIGNGTPDSQDTMAKIIIDESVDPVSVDVYSQEQVDSKVDALNGKDAELEGMIGKNVLVGADAGTADKSVILIDETEGPEYAVYTRAQVDAMFAKLKADNGLV